MDELTREFLIESQEGLDRMERCLTELEERPQDTELISEIFRAVHTIKGTTGFLGFKRLEKLAHAGENLLGLLRDGVLSASEPIITGLLELMDELRGILLIIEAENHEGDEQDTQLIARLHELQHPEAVIVVERAAIAAREAGSTQTQLVYPVARLTPPVIPDPDTAPTPARQSRQVVQAPEMPMPAVEQTAKAGTASDTTLRVDVALLNRMMNLVGELVL